MTASEHADEQVGAAVEETAHALPGIRERRFGIRWPRRIVTHLRRGERTGRSATAPGRPSAEGGQR